MLKKIKILLYSVIVVTVIAMFAEIFRTYDNESLPSNPTIIEIITSKPVKGDYEINNVNQNGLKSTFFNKTTKFIKSKNISLEKLRFNNIDNRKSKIIYSFNKKQTDFSFYRNAHVKQLTRKELNLEDILGVYCTNAKGENLSALIGYFKALGFVVRVSDNSLSIKALVMMLLDNLSQSLVVFASLIGILFIIMLLEKIYRFKAYAVMKINGLSNWQIIKRDFGAQTKLLSISLLLIISAVIIWALSELTSTGFRLFMCYIIGLLLVTYGSFFLLDILSYIVLVLMNSYQAIKGSQRSGSFIVVGYLLKVILLSLVVINAVSLHNNMRIYNRDTSIIKNWHTQKNTYSLGLNFNISDHQESKKIEKRVHQLVVQATDVIISANSELFHPAPRSTDPENGNVIIVNDKFVMHSNLRPQKLKIDPHKITMLVPHNRLNQVTRAKKQLIELIKFQRTLPNCYKRKQFPAIEVKAIASGQKLFNYTVGNEITSSVTTNPIIIVIDKKVFSDDYYSAYASQEMVQFSHLRQLKKLVRRFNLTPYLVGITSQQAYLSDYNMRASRELLMLTVTTILSLLQLVFIILFVSSTFLQNERRKLALYQVFGKSNARLVASFLLTNLGLDSLIIAVILMKLNDLQLIPVALGYLLLETIVILLTYQRSQRKLLLTLNHGN